MCATTWFLFHPICFIQGLFTRTREQPCIHVLRMKVRISGKIKLSSSHLVIIKAVYRKLANRKGWSWQSIDIWECYCKVFETWKTKKTFLAHFVLAHKMGLMVIVTVYTGIFECSLSYPWSDHSKGTKFVCLFPHYKLMN